VPEGPRPILWAGKQFCVPDSPKGQTHDIISTYVTTGFSPQTYVTRRDCGIGRCRYMRTGRGGGPPTQRQDRAAPVENSAPSLIIVYINFRTDAFLFLPHSFPIRGGRLVGSSPTNNTHKVNRELSPLCSIL
jgi:hypothetical protein